MLLYKQQLVVIFISVCCVTAIRVDTGKPPAASQTSSSSNVGDFQRGKEKFNPGPTQSGGWHKPESAVMYGDNAWQEADLSVFGSLNDGVSRHSEGHDASYNDGSASVKVGQIASFSSDNAQQFNGFSGGSLNSGGDLVVGQGSVQRPANAGVQYQSNSGFPHGDSSFPIHTKIGPDTSQYSQVVTTNSKSPLSSVSDYSNRQQIASGDNRPAQVKPIQTQYFGKKPNQQSPQVFGHKISHSYSSSQFPTKHAAPRPQQPFFSKAPTKPVQPHFVPENHPAAGNRFPPKMPPHYVVNSSLRGGAKPPTHNKFPIQPSYQFPKPHPQAQISRGGYSSGGF